MKKDKHGGKLFNESKREWQIRWWWGRKSKQDSCGDVGVFLELTFFYLISDPVYVTNHSCHPHDFEKIPAFPHPEKIRSSWFFKTSGVTLK